VITSNDTPHPHQLDRKLTQSPGEAPPPPSCSRLSYQSLIAAARSRDRDPLT
jgi:hypothetical protein